MPREDAPSQVNSLVSRFFPSLQRHRYQKMKNPLRKIQSVGESVGTASDGNERTQSLTDIFALEGESLYNKKVMIINREIDLFGMGKYQWCIWWLCGFGYLLDLMWAQAFGLVLGPLKQEFGFDGHQQGDISTSFSAGLTAGAAFWGILVDIVGRQWAFNLTVIFSSVFGLALGGSNNYNTFLVLTAFIGFGVGGNIPIDTTITLEFIPQRHRRLLPFLSVFQPCGVVITTAIAYGFIPKYSCSPNFAEPGSLPSCNAVAAGVACCTKANNMGWRYLLFTIGGITLSCLVLRVLVFHFHESPKYLIYRGQDEKAIDVIQKVAKFNGQTSTLSMDTFDLLTESYEGSGDEAVLGGGSKQLQATWRQKIKLEGDRYKMLFSSRQVARLTILIWLTYICDFWGFTVAGSFLPLIVALKNSSLNLSLEYTYRSYVYIYIPGIAGVLIGVFCYDLPRVGRQVTMMVSAALMAASMFIFTTVNTQASNIGLNAMEYIFQSMFNAVLYGWTPEAFPAPIRGTACGLASFWGRLFGIIAPLVAANLLSTVPTIGDYDKCLYLAGAMTFACVLWIALLPRKMVGAESL